MTWYNQTRQVEELLAKTESKPPSFTVHLHAEHWVLNNGSKFLYNNYSLLDDIRAHQLPVDFLDLFDASPNIHFYDGCLIAELLDYRPQKANDPPLEKPGRTRTVLHPTPESLWADVCKIAATKKQQDGLVMTDRDALEIESRLLLATAPPLCLDPDPHLTRMVNHIVRVSTPTVPTSLKRKASAVDQEEDETDKARRAKIMQFMNSRATRVLSANYRILDAVERSKQAKESKVPRVFCYRKSSTTAESSSSRTGGSCKVKTKAKDRASSSSNNLCQTSRSTSSASHPPVPYPKSNHQSIQHAISQDPNTSILSCTRKCAQNIHTFETTTARAQSVPPRPTASATGYTACQGANASSRHISTTDAKPNTVYPPKPCNQYSYQSNQSSNRTQPKRSFSCRCRCCRTLCNSCTATAA
ncbi:Spt20 family-domain-containing protein [Desarmillaria ectypa]|nr:Spt20 family-domain-containing protein [Desarmillaria ectypa]